MDKRVSNVQHVNIVSIDQTSVLQIGDSEKVLPVLNALAVQREKAIFAANEADLSDYLMFQNKIPKPLNEENVCMVRTNVSPYITVGKIDILDLSNSSIVHVGSSEEMESESRIKTIRHFLKEPKK